MTVNDDVEYWIRGAKYELEEEDNPSIQLPATEAEYYIYLKNDGTLGYDTTWTRETLLQDNLYLCAIYLAGRWRGFRDTRLRL